MNDLQFQATRAVAEVDPRGPRGKIPTIARLRDLTGKCYTLRQYIDAVDWAMSRPRYTLTRADKERAVRLMTDRVVEAADNYATTNLEGTIEECLGWLHTRERRRKALLRLAMARTVD